jgi:hypothetical protein
MGMNKGIMMGALVLAAVTTWVGHVVAEPKAAPKPVICYEWQVITPAPGKRLAVCTEGNKPVVFRRWLETDLPRSPDDDPEGRYTRKAIVGWR